MEALRILRLKAWAIEENPAATDRSLQNSQPSSRERRFVWTGINVMSAARAKAESDAIRCSKAGGWSSRPQTKKPSRTVAGCCGGGWGALARRVGGGGTLAPK